jgi:hypothetical protein
VNAAATPEDARLARDGTTLWVVDPTADAVSGFAVTGGRLTELPTSPTPAPIGAAPAGIVVMSRPVETWAGSEAVAQSPSSYAHRTLEGGIGQNLPREAPDADAELGGGRGT